MANTWTQVAGPHKVYQAHLTGEIPWTDESLVEAIELLDAHDASAVGTVAASTYYFTNTFDANLSAYFATG